MDVQIDLEQIKLMLEVIGAFIAPIIYFIFKKVKVHIQTKIDVNKYHNLEETLLLAAYETVGALVVQIFAMLVAIYFLKKSTWEKLYLDEYIWGLGICYILFLTGELILIKIKLKNKTKKSWINNIIYGTLICGVWSIPSLLEFWNNSGDEVNGLIWFLVILIVILQLLDNVTSEKIKCIKYKVYAKKKVYDTIYEPVRCGKDYFIKIANEEKVIIKAIQIPVKNVDRIEHIVKEINN